MKLLKPKVSSNSRGNKVSFKWKTVHVGNKLRGKHTSQGFRGTFQFSWEEKHVQATDATRPVPRKKLEDLQEQSDYSQTNSSF